MRVCCFYNDLDPRVRAALERYAPGCEYVDTSASQQAYAEALDARWGCGEDILLVEQDKEIHASVIPLLANCTEPWCGFTYWLDPVPHTVLCIGGFGATRFSAGVQRLVSVADFAGDGQKNIDRRFCDLLLTYGISHHPHGHVVHHHVYDPRPERVRQHVARLREQGLLPPALYPEPLAPHLLPGSYDLAALDVTVPDLTG